MSDATGNSYLLAGQPAELQRLQLQSRVWEPAGRELLARIPPAGPGSRSVDVGCGVMGWLRLLGEWAGPQGTVVGADIDEKMLANAKVFIESEGLGNVELVRDDLFRTELPAASFDLVHSRFQIAPLGRGAEQMAIYRRLLKPGGHLVVEDPEMGSWRVNPQAPAVAELIHLIDRGFLAAGGDFNAGRSLPDLFRAEGLEPEIQARVLALPPGHPYLRLPLQFAASLRPRLEALTKAEALDSLLRRAQEEIDRPGCWGTTFTLVQVFAKAA